MSENMTLIEVQLKLNEQRLIQAFQIHNEQISEQVKNGIEAAVKSFDFEGEIKRQAESLIKQTISDFMWKGELRALINKKVSDVVQDVIAKHMEKYENNQ